MGSNGPPLLLFELGWPGVRDYVDLKTPFPRGEHTAGYFHAASAAAKAASTRVDERCPETPMTPAASAACNQAFESFWESVARFIAKPLGVGEGGIITRRFHNNATIDELRSACAEAGFQVMPLAVPPTPEAEMERLSPLFARVESQATRAAAVAELEARLHELGALPTSDYERDGDGLVVSWLSLPVFPGEVFRSTLRWLQKAKVPPEVLLQLLVACLRGLGRHPVQRWSLKWFAFKRGLTRDKALIELLVELVHGWTLRLAPTDLLRLGGLPAAEQTSMSASLELVFDANADAWTPASVGEAAEWASCAFRSHAWSDLQRTALGHWLRQETKSLPKRESSACSSWIVRCDSSSRSTSPRQRTSRSTRPMRGGSFQRNPGSLSAMTTEATSSS